MKNRVRVFAGVAMGMCVLMSIQNSWALFGLSRFSWPWSPAPEKAADLKIRAFPVEDEALLRLARIPIMSRHFHSFRYMSLASQRKDDVEKQIMRRQIAIEAKRTAIASKDAEIKEAYSGSGYFSSRARGKRTQYLALKKQRADLHKEVSDLVAGDPDRGLPSLATLGKDYRAVRDDYWYLRTPALKSAGQVREVFAKKRKITREDLKAIPKERILVDGFIKDAILKENIKKANGTSGVCCTDASETSDVVTRLARDIKDAEDVEEDEMGERSEGDEGHHTVRKGGKDATTAQNIELAKAAKSKKRGKPKESDESEGDEAAPKRPGGVELPDFDGSSEDSASTTVDDSAKATAGRGGAKPGKEKAAQASDQRKRPGRAEPVRAETDSSSEGAGSKVGSDGTDHVRVTDEDSLAGSEVAFPIELGPRVTQGRHPPQPGERPSVPVGANGTAPVMANPPGISLSEGFQYARYDLESRFRTVNQLRDSKAPAADVAAAEINLLKSIRLMKTLQGRTGLTALEEGQWFSMLSAVESYIGSSHASNPAQVATTGKAPAAETRDSSANQKTEFQKAHEALQAQHIRYSKAVAIGDLGVILREAHALDQHLEGLSKFRGKTGHPPANEEAYFAHAEWIRTELRAAHPGLAEPPKKHEIPAAVEAKVDELPTTLEEFEKAYNELGGFFDVLEHQKYLKTIDELTRALEVLKAVHPEKRPLLEEREHRIEAWKRYQISQQPTQPRLTPMDSFDFSTIKNDADDPFSDNPWFEIFHPSGKSSATVAPLSPTATDSGEVDKSAQELKPATSPLLAPTEAAPPARPPRPREALPKFQGGGPPGVAERSRPPKSPVTVPSAEEDLTTPPHSPLQHRSTDRPKVPPGMRRNPTIPPVDPTQLEGHEERD